MNVIPIMYHEDNYCYAVVVEGSNCLTLVDPGHIETVRDALARNETLSNLDLKYVLTTHKHWDHAGDNEKIRELYPAVEIFGGAHDSIPGCTRPVQDNECISLENGISVQALHTPCHTRGHILFYFTYNDRKAVFTGDTLFIGGCGKFLEGNSSDMHSALERVKSLPDDTLVYCGHEYTLENLTWASQVDRENLAIRDKLEKVRKLRENSEPTVPSTVAEEKETNVFMRGAQLAGVLNAGSPAAAVGKLREMKNNKATL